MPVFLKNMLCGAATLNVFLPPLTHTVDLPSLRMSTDELIRRDWQVVGDSIRSAMNTLAPNQLGHDKTQESAHPSGAN